MFEKLEVDNNWGNKTFKLQGQELDRIALKKIPLNVKWPDGTVEALTVKIISESGEWYDHGHRGEWSSDVPYLEIDHHGSIIHARMDSLDCLYSF